MGKAANIFERTEKKYLLTYEQYGALMAAIGTRLEDDAYPRQTISSLYYDTPDFAMIDRGNRNPVYKEKIRVRAYGTSCDAASPVFVELKKKFKGVTYKRRVQLARDAAARYLEGVPYDQAAAASVALGALAPEETAEWQTRQTAAELDATIARYPGLAPRIMVCTDRLARRTSDGSDVRITFDLNARWRDWDLDFAHGGGGRAIFPEGRVLMETKTCGAYPLWLARTLSDLQIYPQPCSKVGLAHQAMCAAQHPVKGAYWA